MQFTFFWKGFVYCAPMDTTALENIRSEFPHIREGLIYLNHAARSPLSARVLRAMQRHLDRRSIGPIDSYEDDMKTVNALRSTVQRLINAPSPDRIAFSMNTSDALNIMASGLSWKSGDRILLNDMEFPANVYPYLNLRRFGVEVDTIACNDGQLTPERIEQAMTPRTRVVAVSAVQFLSGFRADLEAIGSLCRSKGALLIVDGIQAVGAARIDVQKMNIDGLACGAQKWLMSPHGTGFVFVTERLQHMIQQQYLGWLSLDVPWNFRDYGQPLAPSARRYEGGTLNFPGLMGMNGALEFMEEIGWETIEKRVAALVDSLIASLERIDGCTIESPRDRRHRAGIVTIRCAPADKAKHVFARLMASHVVISLREGLLRISPHFYNSENEVDTFVGKLRDEMKRG